MRVYPAARLVGLLLAVAAAGQASAQSDSGRTAPASISVGTFDSEQACTLYAVTSGSASVSSSASAGAYADPWGVGVGVSSQYSAAVAWRTELVRDCVDNFAGLRSAMESALAASGKFYIVPAGRRADYVLTGNLSDGGTQSNVTVGRGIDTSATDAGVDIRFSLRDRSGRTIYGNQIRKNANVNSMVLTGQVDSATSSSDRSVYGQLRRDAAFAVARSVAFEIVPLVVTDIGPRRARLNYGAPFLTLGATVYLTDSDGGSAKCTVATVAGDSVWIERDGGGDFSAFSVGARARFVEADDPAANGRRYERVDLPN